MGASARPSTNQKRSGCNCSWRANGQISFAICPFPIQNPCRHVKSGCFFELRQTSQCCIRLVPILIETLSRTRSVWQIRVHPSVSRRLYCFPCLGLSREGTPLRSLGLDLDPIFARFDVPKTTGICKLWSETDHIITDANPPSRYF